VLPIRIHDLDIEDIKLCESVLGGIIRGIEFIYREPGVNKPLTSDDDENKNLNNTKYRIQVNKVANAIKEIIVGFKADPELTIKELTQLKEPSEQTPQEKSDKIREKPFRSVISKVFPAILVTVILAIAAILAYPEIFKHSTLEERRSSGERISVAVMPFQNMTNDTIWNVWQDGIQANLITSLSNNTEDFKVRQTESISSILQGRGLNNYASITPSVAGTVSRKLDADIYVSGNINQAGSIIRLNAKLVDSETEDVLKSFQIDGTAERILPLIDTLSVMVKNFLLISKLRDGLTVGSNYELSTDSPEAFRYYIYGRNEFSKNNYPAARNWYFQALSVDSNYIEALRAVSLSYGNEFIDGQVIKRESNEFLLEQARMFCTKVYEKRDLLSVKEKIYANWIYSRYFESPAEQIIYLRQLLNLDDQNPTTHFNLGACYFRLHQYEQAIAEFEKALEIYSKGGVKPNWIFNYIHLGESYRKTGRFREAKKLYWHAWRDFHGDPNLILNISLLLLSSENTRLANRFVEMGVSYMKSASVPESVIAAVMAYGYSETGFTDKAEEFYRQALSADPENPFRIDDLAYFLIDRDLNVEEGLATIVKALELKPDYYPFLHTKGWGLFKQGKYQEALEVLQKSWDLRRSIALYDHDAFLHLEAAKKAIAGMK